MQSPPCWGWYVKATMKWLFIVLHLCYTELSFHGNLLGLKSFRYKCLVTWAKILIIPWGCCNVMQDILFSSLSQGIRGYHVLFPALTPRCRYYCEDKEVVEQFRMFFDLLTLVCLSPYWKLLCYCGLIMMPFFSGRVWHSPRSSRSSVHDGPILQECW